jgi:hypothetical protein
MFNRTRFASAPPTSGGHADMESDPIARIDSAEWIGGIRWFMPPFSLTTEKLVYFSWVFGYGSVRDSKLPSPNTCCGSPWDADF